MADEKKEAPVTLLNRSKRIFDTIKNGRKFRHGIGKLATYSAEEAKALVGYPELMDVSKIPGSADKAQLESDNAALKAEKEKLEKELAALKGAPAPAPAAESAALAEAPAKAEAPAAPEKKADKKEKATTEGPMGQSTPPATPAAFKAQFSRDFAYGSGLDKVRDLDIQQAINAASSMFNPELFDTSLIGAPPAVSSESLIAYLYATAHFMVTALQAAGGLSLVPGRGLAQQGEGVVTGKSAGGVSVNFSWPARVADDAALFQFTKTTYGQQYLQMLMPRLVGNVSAVAGRIATDLQGGGENDLNYNN
jgi:hypothetical protein